MTEFLEIAFSFPTAVFTLSTIFFLGFWVLTTMVGAGADAFDDLDIDFDADMDVDAELDLDVDASSSFLHSALTFLGITGMPLLIALNLLSLFAWFISVIAVIVLGGPDLPGGWLLGIPILFGSFLASGFLTGRIARRFSHVLVPTLAIRRKQFVGSACTITTQRVTSDFGQAEVRDPEGGSLIVQVRCPKANELTAGDRALIFDLDAEAGVFQISPDKSLAP